MADDLDSDDREIERTQVGARQALIATAGKHDLDEFASVPRYCDEDVLGQIIALAWRHQFDDSRASFKRNIAELQAYVAGRIKLSASGDEG